MTYIIYTDGSDFKHTTRRLGVGGVLIKVTGEGYGEKMGEFSEELDRDEILRLYKTTDCSNPFAEMIAAYRALVKFSPIFKQGDTIILKADYQGVRDWNTGAWKARAPYIKKAKDDIQGLIQRSPWKVDFQWIPGHQNITGMDSFWNDRVDQLAKGQAHGN